MHTTLDIPAIRKKLRLSQAELARQAGVNVSTVWRWENEKIPARGLARAFLERLADDASKVEEAA